MEKRKDSIRREYVFNGTNYELELRGIEYYERLSDETSAYTAELEVRCGKDTAVADVRNNGCGGNTDIQYRGEHAALMRKLDSLLGTLPDTRFNDFCKRNGYNLKPLNLSLETVTDGMMEEAVFGND